jgi:SAM-dependent methyltransferase
MIDVGAGAGFFVEAAHRWGIDCTGLEGSVEGVTLAGRRYAGLDLRHHQLEETFPFPDAVFSVALLNQVIEHLTAETARHALTEVFRVLRPTGLVLVLSPSRFNRAEARADPTHAHLYSPRELTALLRATGFTDVRGLNSPLPVLGGGRLGLGLIRALFALLPAERLSATASCAAYKPSAGGAEPTAASLQTDPS